MKVSAVWCNNVQYKEGKHLPISLGLLLLNNGKTEYRYCGS